MAEEFTFVTAERTETPLKIGLSGTSGSGKTWSSLLIAKGLASDPSKIFMIDTENGSGSLYAGLACKGFQHMTLKAPFSPERLMAAVKAADKAGAEVIIIDTISLFWSGPGGVLDIHEKLGGEFRTWAKTNIHYRTFMNAVFMNPRNTIVTMRAKSDYVIGEDGGRKTVKKVGLKEDMREYFEYELSCHMRIDDKHQAVVEKDRTHVLPDNGIPFPITEETGKILKNFVKG